MGEQPHKKLCAVLAWQLRHGRELEFLQSIVNDFGRIPTPLQERPFLDLQSEYYYPLFFDILKIGNSGSYSGITIDHVLQYLAIIKEESYAERQLIVHLVLSMDQEYRRYLEEVAAQRRWEEANAAKIAEEKAKKKAG